MRKSSKVFLYSSAMIGLLAISGVGIHNTHITPIHTTVQASQSDESEFHSEYANYIRKYHRLHGELSSPTSLRVAYLSKVGHVNASDKDSISDLDSKISEVESHHHESLWKFALNVLHSEHVPNKTRSQDDTHWKDVFNKDFSNYVKKYHKLHGELSSPTSLRVAYLSKVGHVDVSSKDSMSDLDNKVSNAELDGHESLWEFADNVLHSEHIPKRTDAQNDAYWMEAFKKDFSTYVSKHGAPTQGVLTSPTNIEKHYVQMERDNHSDVKAQLSHVVYNSKSLANICNAIEKMGYESVWEYADNVVKEDLKHIPKPPVLDGNVPSAKSLNYNRLPYRSPDGMTQGLRITKALDKQHVAGTHIIDNESSGSYHNVNYFHINNESSNRRIPGINYWSNGEYSYMTPGGSAGSHDAGSPDVPMHVLGIIPYGYRYAIGRMHSHVEWGDLENGSGARNVMVAYLAPQSGSKHNRANHGSVSVWYPKAAQLAGYGNVDVKVTVDHFHYYYPWRGYRSLVFSKNLYDGFMENGLDNEQVHYTFYKPGSKTPIQLDAKGHQSYLEFRDIYGLHSYNQAQTTGGYDQYKNNENFVYHLWKNYPERRVINEDDITGESISNNPDGYPRDEYSPVKNSNIYTYRSQIVNGYNPIHPSFNRAPAVGGHYSVRDIYNGKQGNTMYFILHGTSANFNATSGVGYANIQPFTNIQGMKQSTCPPNKPCSPVIPHKNPGKPHKPSYPPYSPNLHGVTKSVKVSHDAEDSNSLNPIDHNEPSGYSTNGGQLYKKGQDYEYDVASNLPDVEKGQSYYNVPHLGVDYPYSYKVGKDFKPILIPHYFTWYTRHYYVNRYDHYDLTDSLPQDVTVNGTPRMYFADGSSQDGQVERDDRNGRTGYKVVFQLDKDDWESHNLESYNIKIPVSASNLPKISKDGYYKADDGSEKQVSSKGDWYKYDNKVTPDELIKSDWHGIKNNTYNTPSNSVPVEIKQIAAHIWHYDYNHDGSNKMYPEESQHLGIDRSCDNYTDDPNSLHFKDYRWKDGQFAENTPSDNRYDGNNHVNKKNSVLWKDDSYGYVDDTFNEPTIKQNKNGHADWSYRTAYNTIPSSNTDSFAKRVTDLENDGYHDSRSTIADNNRTVPINYNPNGCDTDAYSSDGFTQDNYLPYIVPKIDLYTPKTPTTTGSNFKKNSLVDLSQGKDSRMVIDTDRASHGLPFHYDTRVYDALYGADESGKAFSNDFKGDNVTMNVTSPVGSSNDTLYSATRPLAENRDSNGNLTRSNMARFNQNEYDSGDPHHASKVEFPEGKNYWRGYNDSDALEHEQSEKYRYKHFDLQVENVYKYLQSKNLLSKYTTKSGQVWLPIRITYNVTGANNPNHIDVATRPVDTIAYLATKNRITNPNPKGEMAQAHERTTKYGADGIKDNNSDEANWDEANDKGYATPRIEDEKMSVTMPDGQVAKTGYGLTGNSIKFNYIGHVDAKDYDDFGTNALTAYPREFNAKDSHIDDSSDPRNHEAAFNNRPTRLKNREQDKSVYEANYQDHMLSAPMLHVLTDYFNANTPYSSGETDGIGENGNSSARDKDNNSDFTDDAWKGLDSYDNDSNATQADEYWMQSGHGLYFPENLSAGDFYSSYGYLPKETIHNDGDDNSNGAVMLKDGYSGLDNEYKPLPGNPLNDPMPSASRSLTHSSGTTMTDTPTRDKDNDLTSQNESGYSNTEREDITDSGQDERLYTPKFMPLGTYNTYFERPFSVAGHGSYAHRLGGNHFDFDVKMPITFFAHQYLSKADTSSSAEEYYYNIGLDSDKYHAGYVHNNVEKFDGSSFQPILSGKQLLPTNPLLQVGTGYVNSLAKNHNLTKAQKQNKLNHVMSDIKSTLKAWRAHKTPHISGSKGYQNEINNLAKQDSTAMKDISTKHGGTSGPYFRQVPISSPTFSTNMWSAKNWIASPDK